MWERFHHRNYGAVMMVGSAACSYFIIRRKPGSTKLF
jgi:hypothetical protein